MKNFKTIFALLLVSTLCSFAAKAQEYIKIKSTVSIRVNDGVTPAEATALTTFGNVETPAVTTNPCSGTPEEGCSWKITIVVGGCSLATYGVADKLSGIDAYLDVHPLPTDASACGANFDFTIPNTNCTYHAELVCRPISQQGLK